MTGGDKLEASSSSGPKLDASSSSGSVSGSILPSAPSRVGNWEAKLTYSITGSGSKYSVGKMGNTDVAIYPLAPDEKLSDFEYGLSVVNPWLLPLKFHDKTKNALVYNKFDWTLPEYLDYLNDVERRPIKSFTVKKTRISRLYTRRCLLRVISDMVNFVTGFHTSLEAEGDMCVPKFESENIVVRRKKFYFWRVKFCKRSEPESRESAFDCIDAIVRNLFKTLNATLPSDIEHFLARLKSPKLEDEHVKLLPHDLAFQSDDARLRFCKNAFDQKDALINDAEYVNALEAMNRNLNWADRFRNDMKRPYIKRDYGAMTRCFEKRTYDDKSSKIEVVNRELLRFIRNAASHLDEHINPGYHVKDKTIYQIIAYFFEDQLLNFQDVMEEKGLLDLILCI